MIDRDVAGRRFAAQLLVGPPAGTVIDVVHRLLAVQAQDPIGFRLAIRARTTGLTKVDVEKALTEDRSVVVTTLNRGTLHLVTADDYWWLQELTTPPLFTASSRRLEQEGLSPDDVERGVEVIVRAVTDDGPQPRRQLRERLASAGVPVAGQAFVHLIIRASLLGHIVRGPMVDGDHAFVLARDWLGRPPRARDDDAALAELARRYLEGHGPASDRDLAKWSGLPLGRVRRGLNALGDELVEGNDGLVELATRHRHEAGVPPARVLGTFEPVLMGWTSREWILGDRTDLVTSNGLFRAFALVNGRAVATWRRSKSDVAIEPFTILEASDRTALEADAADVTRFLEGTPVS